MEAKRLSLSSSQRCQQCSLAPFEWEIWESRWWLMASEQNSKSFGKWFPGTPSIPKTLQKHSEEFLNIGKRHFHQFRNFVSKASESITGRIPRGHRHTHWLAMRYPTSWGRNIICVDASGLLLWYHYGDCALIETTLMTNPVEPWKMGLLTPHTFFTPCALLQDSRELKIRVSANRFARIALRIARATKILCVSLVSKCSVTPARKAAPPLGARQGFGGPSYPRHPTEESGMGVRQGPLGCDTPATPSKLRKQPRRGCSYTLELRSRPSKPNQRKGQNEKFMNFAHFCEFWCFSSGKQARFRMNFCSGMPPGKVHELAFLWFGLLGPRLRSATGGGVASAPLSVCRHHGAGLAPLSRAP